MSNDAWIPLPPKQDAPKRSIADKNPKKDVEEFMKTISPYTGMVGGTLLGTLLGNVFFENSKNRKLLTLTSALTGGTGGYMMGKNFSKSSSEWDGILNNPSFTKEDLKELIERETSATFKDYNILNPNASKRSVMKSVVNPTKRMLLGSLTGGALGALAFNKGAPYLESKTSGSDLFTNMNPNTRMLLGGSVGALAGGLSGLRAKRDNKVLKKFLAKHGPDASIDDMLYEELEKLKRKLYT